MHLPLCLALQPPSSLDPTQSWLWQEADAQPKGVASAVGPRAVCESGADGVPERTESEFLPGQSPSGDRGRGVLGVPCIGTPVLSTSLTPHPTAYQRLCFQSPPNETPDCLRAKMGPMGTVGGTELAQTGSMDESGKVACGRIFARTVPTHRRRREGGLPHWPLILGGTGKESGGWCHRAQAMFASRGPIQTSNPGPNRTPPNQGGGVFTVVHIFHTLGGLPRVPGPHFELHKWGSGQGLPQGRVRGSVGEGDRLRQGVIRGKVSFGWCGHVLQRCVHRSE